MKRRLRRLAAAAILIIAAACSDSTPAPDRGPKPKPKQETAAPTPSANYQAQPTDWPMHLRDPSQSAAAQGSELKPPFKIAWSYQTGGRITASPIVVDGVAFIGSADRNLYALHAERWGEKWRYRADGEIVYTAAYADGAVVAADMSGKLTGVDAETGQMLWERSFDRWISSPPAAADGLIWAALQPDGILGLNPRTGDTVSETRRQTTLGGVPYAARRGMLIPTAPATAPTPPGDWKHTHVETVRAGGTQLVGFGDGALRAFNAAGEMVWERQIGLGFRAPPAVWGGRIYAPSIDGRLYALENAPDGDDEAVNGASDETPDEAESILRAAQTRNGPSRDAEPGPVFNLGMRAPILEKRNGWARVRDPNGDERWMEPGSWAQLQPADRSAPFLENRAAARFDRQTLMPKGAEQPVWSPDGKRIAFFSRSYDSSYWRADALWVFDPATGQPRKAASGIFLNPRLSWSMDNGWVAYEAYENGPPAAVYTSAANADGRFLAEGEAPAWSPTRHQLALFQHRGESDDLIRINSNGSGAQRLASFPLEGRAADYRPHILPAWSPDGARIAAALDAKYHTDGMARIALADANAAAATEKIDTGGRRIYALAWSPDSQKNRLRRQRIRRKRRGRTARKTRHRLLDRPLQPAVHPPARTPDLDRRLPLGVRPAPDHARRPLPRLGRGRRRPPKNAPAQNRKERDRHAVDPNAPAAGGLDIRIGHERRRPHSDTGPLLALPAPTPRRRAVLNGRRCKSVINPPRNERRPAAAPFR